MLLLEIYCQTRQFHSRGGCSTEGLRKRGTAVKYSSPLLKTACPQKGLSFTRGINRAWKYSAGNEA